MIAVGTSMVGTVRRVLFGSRRSVCVTVAVLVLAAVSVVVVAVLMQPGSRRSDPQARGPEAASLWTKYGVLLGDAQVTQLPTRDGDRTRPMPVSVKGRGRVCVFEKHGYSALAFCDGSTVPLPVTGQ